MFQILSTHLAGRGLIIDSDHPDINNLNIFKFE